MARTSLNEVFGRNLRDHRVAKGWSQEELADRCDLHRTYIGSVERGERNVTLGTLERIARAIGIDPLHLLRG
jgi:transcriptional regulator with XRE-family HTH domain